MSMLEEQLVVQQRSQSVRLVTGTVRGGVVLPDLPLPEGSRVTVSMEHTSVVDLAQEQLFRELAQCDLP